VAFLVIIGLVVWCCLCGGSSRRRPTGNSGRTHAPRPGVAPDDPYGDRQWRDRQDFNQLMAARQDENERNRERDNNNNNNNDNNNYNNNNYN